MRKVRQVGGSMAIALLLAGASAASAAAAPSLSFDDETPPAAQDDPPPSADEGLPFAAEAASAVVERFARWVVSRDDHGDKPFAIVDKVRARVFVYGPRGRLIGSAPALVGSALGDETSPDVGELELAHIPAEQRTTGAGRFDAYIGPAMGESPEVLWLDYDSGLSLHPVITGNQKQRRLQRLETPTPLDNRITFGCINVPADFYADVIRTAFENKGVVYILPETQDLEAVFPDFRWNRRDRPIVASVTNRIRKAPDRRAAPREPEKLSTILGF